MPGNLNAFQLGPGAVVSLETNQGQVLAIVADADAPTFDPAPITTPPVGTSVLPVGENSSQTIQLNANAQLILTGLIPNRASWLQFLVIQGPAGPFTLTLLQGVGSPARTPGGTGLSLSATAAAQDIVSAWWSGTTLYALVAGKDFKVSP